MHQFSAIYKLYILKPLIPSLPYSPIHIKQKEKIMFEPFSWMFKNNKFKEHFKYLFLILFRFMIPIIILSCVILFDKDLPPLWGYILVALSIILFIIPFMCINGYFWTLTECIINRETDIQGANIYNGKIKECNKITLPEISTKKFIWRGISSTVAIALLAVPIFLLLTSTAALSTISSFPIQVAIAILIFLCLFIPALLWNYAARDSIFAVWNIRKAIYIMGNYTGKYIFNTVLCVIVFILNSAIIALITAAFGVESTTTGTDSIIKSAIISIFSYMIFLYSLYVYAYLLGTITPNCEG